MFYPRYSSLHYYTTFASRYGWRLNYQYPYPNIQYCIYFSQLLFTFVLCCVNSYRHSKDARRRKWRKITLWIEPSHFVALSRSCFTTSRWQSGRERQMCRMKLKSRKSSDFFLFSSLLFLPLFDWVMYNNTASSFCPIHIHTEWTNDLIWIV